MIEINGTYSKAKIYTDSLEISTEIQITKLVNHPALEDTKIRIMPDVHTGKGAVIGMTVNLTNRVVPNIIGVDIGCGVSAWKIGITPPNFEELDKIIREKVPAGYRHRNDVYPASHLFELINLENTGIRDYTDFIDKIKSMEAIKDKYQDIDRVLRSIGSLGGGNHFIEINLDHEGNYWLIIHSGSRSFGLAIALYHQAIAEDLFKPKTTNEKINFEEIVKEAKLKGKEDQIPMLIKSKTDELKRRHWKPSGLEYLEDENREAYFRDMKIAQIYAKLNRLVMADNIINYLGLKIQELDFIESVHNYINFNDNILRKGAISAHKGEKLLIPLNMAEGTILGVGKGNEDWNYSAAHGAGRKLSRTQAEKIINLQEFKNTMKDVWTSCVSEKTIDEAPQAYKNSEEIIRNLASSVDIITIMKPVYNFKAN
ncbi:MAG: RtcB family protein [Candidatus Heimdallarchaeota archaeon]|nr:RtcB family protein [Candidatus Heimdallarchaeota archaeon]